MKSNVPTTRCTSWLADLVELLSVVVASGNDAICAARTEAAAGAVAAGVVAVPVPAPHPKACPSPTRDMYPLGNHSSVSTFAHQRTLISESPSVKAHQ